LIPPEQRPASRLRVVSIFLLGISVGICFTLVFQEIAAHWPAIVASQRR
jgi:hypothetical protein